MLVDCLLDVVGGKRAGRKFDLGRRNAGEIGGTAACDLVADLTDARAGEGAVGAVDVTPPVEAFEVRQQQAKAYGAEPGIVAAEIGAGERMIDRALVRLYSMRGERPNLPPETP